MSDHLKVLLVGAGPMAEAFARVLDAQGLAFDVVGRGAQSAARFAAATGIKPRAGGIEQYLDGRGLPGHCPAIVAVPIQTLAACTRRLIEAGARRILVEKPAGLTIDEIEEVLGAAERAGAQVWVAYNRRFYASVEAARRIIAEDGGVTSFHFEFTELEDRIGIGSRDPAVLANWFLGNSSHVVDLAFHLGGKPARIHGMTTTPLPWHPAGGVFAGHGRTCTGALFTWQADWTSAGRWSIDLRTRRRRLLLQPIETLKQQEKGSFAIVDVPIDDALDKAYKPGVFGEVRAFLSPDPGRTALPTLSDHARSVRDDFLPVLLGGERTQAGERT